MNPLIPVEYAVLTALIAMACAGYVAWRTTRTAPMGLRICMTLLRVLAVACVVLLLLDFGRQRELIQETKSSWAVMLDQSASMSFADVDGRRRWDAAVDSVDACFKAAKDPARGRLYLFSNGVTPAQPADLTSMTPDGDDTRIVESGRKVLNFEKSRGKRLRGILLITDGRQPVEKSPDAFAMQAAARQVPIFPMVLGSQVPYKDLEIQIPRRRYVNFIGQKLSVGGTVINQRLGAQQVKMTLKDVNGAELNKTTILLNDQDSAPFRFEISSQTPGYYEYVISAPLLEGEADRANNSVGIGVFVLAQRLNVLMLEGEPYWDTKFLSHMLREQNSISMTAVFRVTKDRFFKVSTDTAQAVSDLKSFSITEKDLFKYDLVVFGKGSEYFIGSDQGQALDAFVREHGGCLFFARGKSYTGPDSYLKNLEPVTWGRPVESDFDFRPMLSGEQVGLFKGMLPAADDPVWKDLPPLTQAYECPQLNGFSSVLAQGVCETSQNNTFPLLVSKRYGRGLVMLINGDGLWKWGFFPKVVEKHHLYRNLWLHLFQWAVSFAEFNPGSNYFIRTDKTTAHIQQSFQIKVWSRVHTHMETFVVRVYQNQTLVKTMTLAQHSTQKNQYSGLFAPTIPGMYRLSVQTPDGKDLKAQTTIQVLPSPSEMDNLSADKDLLKELAAKSKGKMITIDDLAAVIKGFETPVTLVQKGDIVWESLWDTPWVAIVLVMLFSAEWYFRRQQGFR